MEFTFLGTSAGTPTKSRNVTGLALVHGSPKHWYLIDCGEATQHQLLKTRHSVMQLQAIFITHIHGDHTFGLPGLLTSASMMGRTEPLFLIAPRPVKTFVEAAIGNSDSSLSYELKFVDSEADDFLWEDNDRPELLREACEGAHVVVHEATYTQEVSDRVGPWPQHSSAAQVARFAQAIGIPNLILCHFSSRYQFNPDAYPHIGEVESEARAIYRGNLFLARDFASYTLGKDLMLKTTECL